MFPLILSILTIIIKLMAVSVAARTIINIIVIKRIIEFIFSDIIVIIIIIFNKTNSIIIITCIRLFLLNIKDNIPISRIIKNHKFK